MQFPDVRKATEAVIEVMNRGVGIRMFLFAPPVLLLSNEQQTECVELLDNVSMSALNKYGKLSGRDWAEKDSLFFKFQGPSKRALQETAEIVKKIVEKHGGTGFELARNDEDSEALWKDRRNAYAAGLTLIDGYKGIPTDVW